MSKTITHWNDRYSNKPLKLSEPETFLKENITILKKGSALDIACGDGCNSIFLAGKGFKVTGIDISSVALSRLTSLSLTQELHIQTLCKDIEAKCEVSEQNKYDNILMCRYKSTDDFVNSIPDRLTPEGIFMYITFNTKTLSIRDFPEKFCLKPGELTNKKWELTLTKYQEITEVHGIFDAYIFKKNLV